MSEPDYQAWEPDLGPPYRIALTFGGPDIVDPIRLKFYVRDTRRARLFHAAETISGASAWRIAKKRTDGPRLRWQQRRRTSRPTKAPVWIEG